MSAATQRCKQFVACEVRVGGSVKLTILGGGGFRVPLVYGALLGDRGEGRVTEVVLHDLDDSRLYAVARLLA